MQEFHCFVVVSGVFAPAVLGSLEGLQGKFGFHGSSCPEDNADVNSQCKT